MKRTKLMGRIIGVIFNIAAIIIAAELLFISRHEYGLVMNIVFIVAIVSNGTMLIIKAINRFKHRAQGN